MDLGIDQQIHVNTAYFAEEGRGITIWRHPQDAAYNWGMVMRQIIVDAGVEIRCDSKVTELIVENGEAAGVVVEAPHEGTYSIKAKKVLVASGGFDSNLELFQETFADTTNIETVWPDAAPGATGDAFTFCAPVDPMYSGYGFAKCASCVPPIRMNSLEGNYPVFGTYLWVDKTGARFVDETEWYYQKAERILGLEDAYCYALCCGDLYAKGCISVATEHFIEKLSAYDGIIVANTVEELAEKAGFDMHNLKLSLRDDEMRVNGGKLDTYGGRLKQAFDETGPYYAVKLICASGLALYGFKLEEGTTRMVNTSGEVIPNLFACGEVAISNYQFGQYAFMGSAITWAIFSGAIAGEDIVAELDATA